MDAGDLTKAQAERLAAQVGTRLGYFNRLCERMEKLGWRLDDPVYLAAVRAREAVHALRVLTHYASCESGFGKEPSAKKQRGRESI